MNYGYSNYPTYFPSFQSAQIPPQNGFQPQNERQTPIANTFSCRPVTSREEAVAAQIDFMGMGTVMPDLAHNVIYLKRFNINTGTCDFYCFKQEGKEEETQVRYATLEDLEELKAEIENLKRPVKVVKKHDPEE